MNPGAVGSNPAADTIFTPLGLRGCRDFLVAREERELAPQALPFAKSAVLIRSRMNRHNSAAIHARRSADGCEEKR